MEEKKLATYEEMRAEAILRMKRLGVAKEYIDKFENVEWVYTFDTRDGSVSDEEDWDAAAFEMFVDLKIGEPWAIIMDTFEDNDAGRWIDHFVLFVSPNPENWEKEREELSSLEPVMYKFEYNMTSPEINERGLVKKKIRLSKAGTPVLDEVK